MATTPATSTRELSGAQWVQRFPGSRSVSDLDPPFRTNLRAFLSALDNAGASVRLSATVRPPERAYLMHWSWMMVNRRTDPTTIPALAGVNIQWDHGDAAASLAAAQQMVNGLEMQSLGTAPALDSRHGHGEAVDMTIAWSGTLSITDQLGTVVQIDSMPRSGMNAALATVGASYGVLKYDGAGVDRPHWSSTGR